MADAATPGSPGEWIDLLGMRITRAGRSEVEQRLREYIAAGEPRHVVTADASALVIAGRDPEYLAIVNRAALVTPDGAGVLWASRRLGVPIAERVSGVDLAEHLIRRSGPDGYDVYLYGAEPGVVDEAAATMRARYPDCRISGTQHGYLKTDEERRTLVREITERRPAVLLVALGIPAQEKWISAHLDELGVPVCIGVGGSFDVFSGRARRAPHWMQANGLEWLYRLIQNPKKISKASCLPLFVLRVLFRRRVS